MRGGLRWELEAIEQCRKARLIVEFQLKKNEKRVILLGANIALSDIREVSIWFGETIGTAELRGFDIP